MTSGYPVLESLKAVAPELARRDAPGLAALLAPYLDRLREPPAAERVKEAVDAVSAACRALYADARSAEALPLARGLLEHCLRAGDRDQTRRAAGVCGLLAADSADVVAAIQYHVQSLRIAAADENRLEMARSWNNLGHAMNVSGRAELAVRCFRRCVALLEPIVQPTQVRYAALGNLADCQYQLGEHEDGIRCGELALHELSALGEQDPYALILLRRNLARLLIALGRVEEAQEQVVEAIALGEASPSPRVAIAADITRAAHDLAMGDADVALTRIDRTLAKAREVPATLHDALACAVRAEEAAGFPGRALLRLQELSQHLYGHAVERTRRVIEMAGMDPTEPATEFQRQQVHERLASMLSPPAPPRAWGTLRRLAASAVMRMDDTGWHGVRVGALVKALALARGLPPLQALELGLAAELHDIGLSSVPAAVLAKKAALNDAERALVHRHTEAGAAMLVDDPHPRLLLARDIARYHHARWDGTGHPERVAGVSIPLGARMCAIADAYDAMVCGLGGRPPVSMGEALAELRRCAGGQFDPELVSCFDAVVNGELEGMGRDPGYQQGMEAFQELIASLRENRGFV